MAVIPDVPTGLERVGPGTDNTPLFRANISSSESDVDLKARFRIFEPGDAVNLVTHTGEALVTHNAENIQVPTFDFIGDVDSPYKLNGGTVEAEYGNALSRGSYTVKALTITDNSVESFETGSIVFFVTVPIQSPMFDLLWNIRAYVDPQTFQLRWNVTVGGQADFMLRWDIIGAVVHEETLLWLKRTPWRQLEENEDIWRRIY